MFGPFRKRKDRRQELLSAYLDGRLLPAEQAAVERLLAKSEDARRELEALRQTVAMLRQLPRVQATRSFTLTPAMADARPPRTASSGWLRIAMPLAASAAVAFLVFTLVGGSRGLFDSQESSGPSQKDQSAFQAVSPTQPGGPNGPAGTLGPAGPAGPKGEFGATDASRSAATATAAPGPTSAPPSAATGLSAPIATARVPGAAGPLSSAGTQASTTPSGQAPPAVLIPDATVSATPTPAPQPTITPGGPSGPAGSAGPAGPAGSVASVAPQSPQTDKFPWLPLQITAGALAGLGLVATLWQFRKARAKRGPG